jgi:hypothetical protein
MFSCSLHHDPPVRTPGSLLLLLLLLLLGLGEYWMDAIARSAAISPGNRWPRRANDTTAHWLRFSAYTSSVTYGEPCKVQYGESRYRSRSASKALHACASRVSRRRAVAVIVTGGTRHCCPQQAVWSVEIPSRGKGCDSLRHHLQLRYERPARREEGKRDRSRPRMGAQGESQGRTV